MLAIVVCLHSCFFVIINFVDFQLQIIIICCFENGFCFDASTLHIMLHHN